MFHHLVRLSIKKFKLIRIKLSNLVLKKFSLIYIFLALSCFNYCNSWCDRTPCPYVQILTKKKKYKNFFLLWTFETISNWMVTSCLHDKYFYIPCWPTFVDNLFAGLVKLSMQIYFRRSTIFVCRLMSKSIMSSSQLTAYL